MKLNKKQIGRLCTKSGDLRNKFSCRSGTLRAGGKQHLKFWSGGNRSLHDSTHYTLIELLDILNIKYVVGNDSARGGATGDYIKFNKSPKKADLLMGLK